MIIWSGRGFLPLAIWLILNLIFFEVVPKEYSSYSSALTAFLTAGLSWFLGVKWNNKVGRIVLDETTGERLELKDNHSLFWIKMQYWGIIYGVLVFYFVFQLSITIALVLFAILLSIVGFLYFRKKNCSSVNSNRDLD